MKKVFLPLALICSLTFAGSKEDFRKVQTKFAQDIEQQMESGSLDPKQILQAFLIDMATLAEKYGKTKELEHVLSTFEKRMMNLSQSQLTEQIRRYQPDFSTENIKISVEELHSCLLFFELEEIFQD